MSIYSGDFGSWNRNWPIAAGWYRTRRHGRNIGTAKYSSLWETTETRRNSRSRLKRFAPGCRPNPTRS